MASALAGLRSACPAPKVTRSPASVVVAALVALSEIGGGGGGCGRLRGRRRWCHGCQGDGVRRRGRQRRRRRLRRGGVSAGGGCGSRRRGGGRLRGHRMRRRLARLGNGNPPWRGPGPQLVRGRLSGRRFGARQRVERLQIDGDLRQCGSGRTEQCRQQKTGLSHARQITGERHGKTVNAAGILFTRPDGCAQRLRSPPRSTPHADADWRR